MPILRSLIVALLLSLTACASSPTGDAGASFVVVRHAEKTVDGTRDPPLSAAGVARAQRLARSLRGHDLRATYATQWRRTRQTAAPAATLHGLDTLAYDAETPAADFAARLRRAHSGGTVLVVGHSNTVPGIAAALCGCAVAPMEETEYERRMTVRIAADGTARLTIDRDP